MDEKIKIHFKKHDTTLFTLLEKIELIPLEKPKNYFERLCKQIINQQLSTKAGATIFERFKKLFPKSQVTAKFVLEIADDKIRQSGLSYSKIKYIKALAQAIVSKELILESLEEKDDEEVIVQLTKIKGIGRWTAEMFLLFALGREDIFSHGDLGLRNAIKKLYKLEEPTREDVEKIIAKWSPYKSVASRILWRSLDL